MCKTEGLTDLHAAMAANVANQNYIGTILSDNQYYRYWRHGRNGRHRIWTDEDESSRIPVKKAGRGICYRMEAYYHITYYHTTTLILVQRTRYY